MPDQVPRTSPQHTKTVPIELPDGTAILAEVTATGSGGDASRQRLRLSDIRGDITRISQFLSESLADALPDPPRRYGVEFGLKLGVETTGLTTILAKATGEASVVVKLEWER